MLIFIFFELNTYKYLRAGSLIKFPANNSSEIYMPAQYRIILSGPDEWKTFSGAERAFYVDTAIIDAGTVMDKSCPAHAYIALSNAGVRPPTDREYSRIVKSDAPIRARMRERFTPTGILKNVREKCKWRGGGFSARYIESPEIKPRHGNSFRVWGKSRRVTLPPRGLFSIGELLWSETGLPEKTYSLADIGGEDHAYFIISEGEELVVMRGMSHSTASDSKAFAVSAVYRLADNIHNMGMMAVSDIEPAELLKKYGAQND